jgi:hypothetical protein
MIGVGCTRALIAVQFHGKLGRRDLCRIYGETIVTTKAYYFLILVYTNTVAHEQYA